MNTALIIESDELAGSLVQLLLRKENFRVLTAQDVMRAVPAIQEESPDLIVLLLTSRHSTAPGLCQKLRNWSSAPILAVSSLSQERLIVDLLDAGADGFVSLPFRPEELLARIRALLRGSAGRPQNQDIVRSGDLEIDVTQRRVLVAGNAVRLTRTEFNILKFLARNRDRAVSTEAILEAVWGPVHGEYTQSLRVHIGHIRRKIEPEPSRPRYLITHRGGRYLLSGAVKQPRGKED